MFWCKKLSNNKAVICFNIEDKFEMKKGFNFALRLASQSLKCKRHHWQTF